MVDLLGAFDLRRVVGEVLVDDEAEVEDAVLVHALIRVDGQGEVEDVVRVGKVCLHGGTEGELRQVCDA